MPEYVLQEAKRIVDRQSNYRLFFSKEEMQQAIMEVATILYSQSPP